MYYLDIKLKIWTQVSSWSSVKGATTTMKNNFCEFYFISTIEIMILP